MAKRAAADIDDELIEDSRPVGPIATYADVPVALMDKWATQLEGFPCNAVSDVFLRWAQESGKTGFIPPPPPRPTPEQLAGPPKVELTAKGLPSFRCVFGASIDAWICRLHLDTVLVSGRLGPLEIEWDVKTTRCGAGSALDV